MFPPSEEPAVLAAPPPFLNDLAVTLVIFALYFGLVKVALLEHWTLANRIQSDVLGLSLFSLICFGLTVIVVFSAITWPLRMLAGRVPFLGKHLYEWQDPEPMGLLSCSLCTSFWIGSLISVLGVAVLPVTGVLDVVANGLLGAGTTWLFYAITQKLGVYSH